MTNRGICSAFNSGPTNYRLKGNLSRLLSGNITIVYDTELILVAENPFLEAFESTFSLSPANKAPLLSHRSGDLDLLLDSHQSEILGSERGSFWLKLTQAGLDQLDASEDGAVQVEAGGGELLVERRERGQAAFPAGGRVAAGAGADGVVDVAVPNSICKIAFEWKLSASTGNQS